MSSIVTFELNAAHRPLHDILLTSTELVVGSVTVEIVALAVQAAVDLCGILSLLAFTAATDTVTVVAADISTIVFPAVGIQILCLTFVSAALTETPNASLIAPDTEDKRLVSLLRNNLG